MFDGFDGGGGWCGGGGGGDGGGVRNVRVVKRAKRVEFDVIDKVVEEFICIVLLCLYGKDGFKECFDVIYFDVFGVCVWYVCYRARVFELNLVVRRIVVDEIEFSYVWMCVIVGVISYMND